MSRHEIKAANIAAIDATSLKYEFSNNQENMSFYDGTRHIADFYPSTGRWCYKTYRTERKVHTCNGGAEAFIKWYNSREVY